MTDDRQSPVGLVLMSAPAPSRDALRTLFDLDERLGQIVRTTREPLVGQMRLAWWRDALIALDAAAAPAEPLLRAIQTRLLPRGVSSARLAGMIDGWEDIVVAETVDDAAIDSHIRVRGEGLFAIAATLIGRDSPQMAPAGRAWAAADLAAGLSDPAVATMAMHAADVAWSEAFSAPWPAALRPIGALSLIAMLDRDTGARIGKALRLTRFRLTGR